MWPRRLLIEEVMNLLGRMTIPLIGLLLLMPGCFSPGADQDQAEGASAAKLTADCLDVEESNDLTDQLLQIINLERAAENLPYMTTNRIGPKSSSPAPLH